MPVGPVCKGRGCNKRVQRNDAGVVHLYDIIKRYTLLLTANPRVDFVHFPLAKSGQSAIIPGHFAYGVPRQERLFFFQSGLYCGTPLYSKCPPAGMAPPPMQMQPALAWRGLFSPSRRVASLWTILVGDNCLI